MFPLNTHQQTIKAVGPVFRSWQTIDDAQRTGLAPHPWEIPVAILSLEDQRERRRLLCERGLPREWVEGHWPATDLRRQESKTLKAMLSRDGYSYHPDWPPSVTGCALSHGKVAEWQVLLNRPLMLVLEDDVIPASADYLDSLATVARLLLPSASAGESFICHLGVRPEQMSATYSRVVKTSQLADDRSLLRLCIDPRSTIWRAHAYLISLAAARKSSRKNMQLKLVADDWCARAAQGFFDRLYLATPRVFLQDELVRSTLDHTKDGNTEDRQLSTSNFGLRVTSSLAFRARMIGAKLLSKLPVSI